jgi:hypothetical protein
MTAIRAALRSNRPLASVLAFCWFVARFASYPAGYLTSFDPEIWMLQAGTWLILVVEALALGAAASLAATGVRALISSRRMETGLGGLSSRALRYLDSRKAPLAAGLLSAAAACYVWGLRPVPLIHDEAAYLLQAKLFATGRWTAPPAPMPEFFEQMYVFVSPFTAAKYPPGFPLALVPGIWLGIPVVVPILLFGVSGALLFSLARKIAGPPVAALTWLLWTTVPHAVWPLAPFLSQHLSTALWLGAWWALLRWREQIRLRDLLLLVVLLGWGAMTRPLTMLAAAVPMAFVVLPRVIRRRLAGQLAVAATLGLCLLALIPLWSAKTTGDWRVTPLALHLRWYTPYDFVGFGWRSAPPIRPLPPDLENARKILSRERQRHTLSRLPFLVAARASQIRENMFPGWRRALIPLIVFGLFFVPVEGRFAAATALLSFLAHLILAHLPQISMYYLEAYPVLAFLAAAGLIRLFAPHTIPSKSSKSKPGAVLVPRPIVPAMIVLALAVVPALLDVRNRHDRERAHQEPKVNFASEVSSLPEKSIVFVRYPSDEAAFVTFIENGPDFASQRSWIVHDLGESNLRLIASAPDRTPYLYVASENRFARLSRTKAGESPR